MSTGKFEFIWKFLKDNQCSEADNICEEVICIICRRILVDPCVACCGCRYCLQCVTEYVRGQHKYCPGDTDECREDFLQIASLVHPDYAANRRISRLVVQCPGDSCEFKDELGKMADHDRVCKKKAVRCPYFDIGCQERRLVSDRIDEHLAGGQQAHARLLMECVGGLHNEIGAMKRSVAEASAALAAMRTERAAQQALLAAEMEALRSESRSVAEQNESLRTELEKYRAEHLQLAAATEQHASATRDWHQTLSREMKQLGQDCWRKETQIANEREELRTSVDEMREKQARLEEVAQRVREMDALLEMACCEEFLWVVSDWASVCEFSLYPESGKVFSEQFASHDGKYKMCVAVWPDRHGGGNCLSLWWHLERGPYDDILPWPFRGVVTLAVINQHTGAAQTVDSISYREYPDHLCWRRPRAQRNQGFASSEMVDIDSLSRDPALCQDNRVFIRCVVRRTA